MAKERNYRVVKIHTGMVEIFEKFRTEFEKKHKIEISYVKASKLIAEKIKAAGGVKV